MSKREAIIELIEAASQEYEGSVFGDGLLFKEAADTLRNISKLERKVEMLEKGLKLAEADANLYCESMMHGVIYRIATTCREALKDASEV